MPVAAEPVVELETLQSFSCPVCGRVRSLTARSVRQIELGRRSGECQTGSGCRAAIDDDERLLRFWLIDAAGISEQDVRAAGGAASYVLEHGLPALLADLAAVLPADAELVERPRGSIDGRASG